MKLVLALSDENWSRTDQWREIFVFFLAKSSPLASWGPTRGELDFYEKNEIFQKKYYFRIYMIYNHNRIKYES